MMRPCVLIAITAQLVACTTTSQSPAVSAAGQRVGSPAAYSERPPLLPPYTRVELENGVVLLLLEKHEVPLVGFEAILRGGSVADPVGMEGTASLLAELLRKGAGDRSAEQFAATVEGAGGALDTGAGLESIAVSGEFLSKDAALAVSLLADLLMRPALDSDEFEKLRQRSIQFIKAAKDGSPSRLLPYYSSGFVFAGHPYGRASSGTETSLTDLSIDAVRNYYRDQVGADRLILAVAGDFDTAAMISMLRDAFGAWRPAARPLPEFGPADSVGGHRVFLIDKPDATQTYFWIGNVGVSRYYPGRAALALANTVFGGSYSSMLNTELRIRTGLTYGARSTLSQPRERGSVGISSFTATETTIEAIDLALATLERLHAEGISGTALDSARSYILGQYPLGFETGRQLARQAAQLNFYGLEDSWVNNYAQDLVATSPEDVGRVVAEVYPRRDELVYVLIGNAGAIRDAVTRYGDITEMTISEPRFTP